MKLSYSNYKTYIQCPRLYKNQVTKVPPPVKDSAYFALYGLLIESYFKKHTNIYTKQNVQLTDDKIRDVLKVSWDYILEKRYVDWTDPWVKYSSNDIFEQVYVDVLANLKKFDFWKNSQAEVSFEIFLKKSEDVLTCRMDFICDLPDGTVEILDGKGTNKIDTNVDVEQLLFYALIYLLKNKRLPDKLGFLYYRYQLVKYIDFNMDDVMAFKDKLALVKKGIKSDTEFQPKVGLSKQCKYCLYRFGCDAFNAKKEANAAKKASKIEAEYTGELIDL